MRPADMVGPGTRIWCANRVAKPSDPADWQGTLGLWLVHQPGVHAFWSWWSVGVIHLRPIPGVRPPYQARPTATHEVLMVARDLGIKDGTPVAQLDPDNPDTWGKLLMPVDVAHQVDNLTDEMAKQLGQLAMRTIASGRISPDSDYRSAWAQLLDGTAAHLREGKHLPG